ncbi:pentatricopeptide repeat-containing protein At5g15280, mitochondrial [Amaranthus tricolor]|uniref:pentatricopeptide repeat-containing protein At5g15280, mitochondrial n=1 Tax=Amaranthus tricolor TaxID=29722 RepID=UPI00258FBA18|nr:pentatricopeptide repeat-containing protein At5g15280, mitochondrial [Amaranthus tricolor]XP_057521765.1 pentatricopeptide repeat-containing protein At5g15280, mitochondrial [Amaranthus tricolor]XP_057521766.1 pentatricopeptide repeat-containing protein At5g15280, mitochondrial [Amaranthus tricolor]XP_057521767.1 pentatricopeptide repeat-containing protein At5g15280, mitochondrial [Amaranthus tricolor]XP_057521768.1 pentatricopeptide repeat-containing protein At5g15280, mitochondrial [Amaran
MLPRISTTHLRTPIVNQVHSFFSSFFPLKSHQFMLCFFLSDSPLSRNSSNTVPLVGKEVLSKCTHLLNQRINNFTITSLSLNQLLLNISYVSPGICRKYLRVSSWKPEYMLEILMNFQSRCSKSPITVEVVEFLWEIFWRISNLNAGFKHLPRSYEILAIMLINMGMFREVDSLLSTMKMQGIMIKNDDIFNGLIEGYVNLGESERALLIYDIMRGLSLAPSLSCYHSLIGILIKGFEVDRVIRIFEDVIEVGFEFSVVEAKHLDSVIGFLCEDGMVRIARKLLQRIVATGWKPSTLILTQIADVYYQKMDFDDILSFYSEMKSVPDVSVGNKIIYSLCSNFGIERAISFLLELENIGFIPNEITFGNFISQSCVDGNIREAFFYLSEILSRGLKPDGHSYNALISGLFKAGMPEHAQDIFNEMIDNGVKPSFATFRALIAGYSKARLFNEVELMMTEMVKYGLISLAPSENSLSKAFTVLGLNPMTVKVKRDNDIRNFRTEFFDALGNGLYLDTDIDEFEKVVMRVLQESLSPDFNVLLMRQCDSKNVQEALLMVDEIFLWGQELSLSVLSALVKLLCESNSIKEMLALLNKGYQCFWKLDHETLNFAAVTLSKNGSVDHCSLLRKMYRKRITIFSATHSAFVMAVCKHRCMSDIRCCWSLARNDNWSPDWDDFIVILESLCHKRMLKELLELFDIMLAANPDLGIQICDVLLENLSSAGLTGVGQILVDELKQKDFDLGHTVYRHLVKGYHREKKFLEALMMFDRVRADNLALSSDALVLLIPKLCKTNRFKEAVALKDAGFRDNPLTLYSLQNALIMGCCSAGLIAEADGLFFELILDNFHPNDEVINALLQGHCRSSDMKTAKELFCFMMKRNISLSVSSYRDLLSLFCNRGLFHYAWGLESIMLSENTIPYSIIRNIFIFCLFRIGKPCLVDTLLGERQKGMHQLDKVGYNFLIHGFSVSKDMPRSMKFLKDMISKGLRPSNRSLRAVIQNLCRNGQVKNALQLSKHIESRGWILCATVHYAIVEGFIADGRIHQAERYLAQIMGNGATSEMIYFDHLIRKFCHYGRLETAVNLLDQILEKKSIPEASSYDCIVQSFCGFDNLECAMDFLNEMLIRNLKPSIGTWDAIIQMFCDKGQTVEAEGVLNLMINVGENPTKSIYSSVIDRYRLEQNFSKASEFLSRMQHDGYEPDFVTQWSVISGISNSNEMKSNKTEGFLSKLLVDSGFPSAGDIS